MVSIDLFTIAGMISVVALAAVIITLCNIDNGCNGSNC